VKSRGLGKREESTHGYKSSKPIKKRKPKRGKGREGIRMEKGALLTWWPQTRSCRPHSCTQREFEEQNEKPGNQGKQEMVTLAFNGKREPS